MSLLAPPRRTVISALLSLLTGASFRYHSGDETPIQVYQTMRLDQIMWNCIAAYHVTAMDATSNISAMTRPPATSATVAYHTSQNRILCSTHAINGLLVAGLVVNAVKPFQTRMAVAGLDPTVPTADEINAASASEVLYFMQPKLTKLTLHCTCDTNDQCSTLIVYQAPYWIGHRLAAAMLVTMRTDGSNFDGAKNRWGQTCPETKKCFAYGDDGSMPRFTPTNDPWTQASTNPLDWKPQLETNMFGFLSANGHTVPHFGNMQTFLIDKASQPCHRRLQWRGCQRPPPDHDDSRGLCSPRP